MPIGPQVLETCFKFEGNNAISVGRNFRGEMEHFTFNVNPKSLKQLLVSKENPTSPEEVVTPGGTYSEELALASFFSVWLPACLFFCVLFNAYKGFAILLSLEIKQIPVSNEPGTSQFRIKHLIPVIFLSQEIFVDLARKHGTSVEQEQYFYKQTVTRLSDLSKQAVFISTSVVVGTVVRFGLESVQRHLPVAYRSSPASKSFLWVAAIIITCLTTGRVVSVLLFVLETPYKAYLKINSK